MTSADSSTSGSSTANTSEADSTGAVRFTDGVFPLRRVAHGRTGDKGNRSCISVIAYRDEFWPLLVEQVTEAAVAGHFAFRRPGRTVRYLLPRLCAMNFVIDDVLDGGVNDSLNLDSHGKALSFLLLDMPIHVPPQLRPLLAGGLEPDAV